MQTFLPYPDFERSARVLDVRRLGKQRVECLQVVRGLTATVHGISDDLPYVWPTPDDQDAAVEAAAAGPDGYRRGSRPLRGPVEENA